MKAADGIDPETLGELIGDQIKAQGCGVVRVEDGQVFVFTTDLLEKLLAASIESGEGMAIVFVKAGAVA